jgi:membrane protein YqaA with SNARE-associated domain
MHQIINVILFGLLAATKLLLAPAAMLAAGYHPISTMIITYIGALVGSVVFYYFGVAIFNWWDRVSGKDKKDKFVFSKKSRAMVKVKIRYGIIGLAAMAPIISVPISAFIVAKFFPGKNKVIGIYAIVLIPISVGLTLISEPIITPIVELIKQILNRN